MILNKKKLEIKQLLLCELDLSRPITIPEIMHGRAPEVFLHQKCWNVAI
jgi:hypothetical protein